MWWSSRVYGQQHESQINLHPPPFALWDLPFFDRQHFLSIRPFNRTKAVSLWSQSGSRMHAHIRKNMPPFFICLRPLASFLGRGSVMRHLLQKWMPKLPFNCQLPTWILINTPPPPLSLFSFRLPTITCIHSSSSSSFNKSLRPPFHSYRECRL